RLARPRPSRLASQNHPASAPCGRRDDRQGHAPACETLPAPSQSRYCARSLFLSFVLRFSFPWLPQAVKQILLCFTASIHETEDPIELPCAPNHFLIVLRQARDVLVDAHLRCVALDRAPHVLPHPARI